MHPPVSYTHLAGVWDYNSPRKNVLNAFMLNHSDIISYHNYDNEAQHAECIKFLKMLNRPLICTEYMARRNDSRFCNVLPLMKKEKTGAINWDKLFGLMNKNTADSNGNYADHLADTCLLYTSTLEVYPDAVSEEHSTQVSYIVKQSANMAFSKA